MFLQTTFSSLATTFIKYIPSLSFTLLQCEINKWGFFQVPWVYGYVVHKTTLGNFLPLVYKLVVIDTASYMKNKQNNSF